AAADGGVKGPGFPDEVLGDEELLPILSAAHVVEVVLPGHDRVSHPERGDLELVAAPGGPTGEHGDVPAVGVDVEVVRVKVTAPKGGQAGRPKWGSGSRRSARSRCRPSIAV